MDAVLVFPGNCISLKNSKQIVWAGRHPKVVSSKPYKLWRAQALLELRHSPLIDYPWTYPLVIRFDFYRTTRRSFDLHNMVQGPLDLMVELEIIKDDSYQHVLADLVHSRVLIDKQRPRTELFIYERGNNG